MIALLYALLYIILIASSLAGLLFTGVVIALFIVRVPFAPTPKKNVKVIIDLLDLKPGQIFYDLGCGDGQFLIEAGRRGAKAIGFEISPWIYFKARLNILINQSPAQVFFKNFYHVKITDADRVFCFLITSVMPKVEKKLKAELRPGAKIVCYGFKLPNWQPDKIIYTNPYNRKASKIFLYTK